MCVACCLSFDAWRWTFKYWCVLVVRWLVSVVGCCFFKDKIVRCQLIAVNRLLMCAVCLVLYGVCCLAVAAVRSCFLCGVCCLVCVSCVGCSL